LSSEIVCWRKQLIVLGIFQDGEKRWNFKSGYKLIKVNMIRLFGNEDGFTDAEIRAP